MVWLHEIISARSAGIFFCDFNALLEPTAYAPVRVPIRLTLIIEAYCVCPVRVPDPPFAETDPDGTRTAGRVVTGVVARERIWYVLGAREEGRSAGKRRLRGCPLAIPLSFLFVPLSHHHHNKCDLFSKC